MPGMGRLSILALLSFTALSLPLRAISIRRSLLAGQNPENMNPKENRISGVKRSYVAGLGILRGLSLITICTEDP